MYKENYQIPPDVEWKKAERANEPYHYYRVKMLNGGSRINYYKPSVAKLVQERMYHHMAEIPCV